MQKILVVEDDANLCLLYRTALIADGYAVGTVACATEALAEVESWGPDLVVLDLKMAPTDGLSVLDAIRVKHRELPVVINTAYPYFKSDFASWGADAFVVKSADLTELRQTIAGLLERAST